MGYGNPGRYGGGEVIGAATPHIYKIAQDGLKLTSCYSQHICIPLDRPFSLEDYPSELDSGATNPSWR